MVAVDRDDETLITVDGESVMNVVDSTVVTVVCVVPVVLLLLLVEAGVVSVVGAGVILPEL